MGVGLSGKDSYTIKSLLCAFGEIPYFFSFCSLPILIGGTWKAHSFEALLDFVNV